MTTQYTDEFGPNVKDILIKGTRIVRDHIPAPIRKELYAAVKAGALGHLKKDGMKPEIFFHPDYLDDAIEFQKSEVKNTIQRNIYLNAAKELQQNVVTEFTENEFLNDVRDHEMFIAKDDGLYRHIEFKKYGPNGLRFDIITWPNYLCYTGDMGTYVFSKQLDMFTFFRKERDLNQSKDCQLKVNFSYWAEKVASEDCCYRIESFNEILFNRAVMEDLVGWIREKFLSTTKEERRELWENVREKVIKVIDVNIEGHRKQNAVYDFKHYVNEKVGSFSFKRYWGKTIKEYTRRYKWCCYALAWGIMEYDKALTKSTQHIWSSEIKRHIKDKELATKQLIDSYFPPDN